ncbi:MAG: sigma-70 family RNA polymerase sigma factor [Tissierellales bacterium]|nr:sigma-70 family RNA polymerase sigma factor [Tissierellales bacterium]
MLEDKLLIWKFKRGSDGAIKRIYEKYYGYLVSVATALLNDINTAEDVVHDFFISFVQSAEKLKLDGSLKAYSATCVANLARDRIRKRQREPMSLDNNNLTESRTIEPGLLAIQDEESIKLNTALSQLPYEQREVIVLHLQGNMKFTQISKLQNIPVNTIRSQYRYGLNKLRALLNNEVIK